MSKSRQRGSVVEKVRHPKTRREGVLRLDRSRMMFYAREDDGDFRQAPFESKDGGAVRQWLMAKLGRADGVDMTWEPVIEIEHGGATSHRYRGDDQAHGESLRLEIDRFFLGLTPDKVEWRKLPWHACDPESSAPVEPADRWSRSEKHGDGPAAPPVHYREVFRLPMYRARGHEQSTTTVRYTPELWAGLLALVAAVAEKRGALEKLLGTKAGLAALSSGLAQPLLPPSPHVLEVES